MKAKENTAENEFHAVEFMRRIREKRSQEYLDDPEKYLEDARQAMEDFKLRLAKVSHPSSLDRNELNERES